MAKHRHPFTALPDNLFGILEGHEWAVMMALAHHGYSSYPSQQRISTLAGISLATTKRVLFSLKEKGLVEWDSRKRPDGGQGSNLYRLTIDHLWNPAPLAQGELPPSSQRATPQLTESYEQDLLEQDSKEPIEAPLTPLASEPGRMAEPLLERGQPTPEINPENVLRIKVIPEPLQPLRNEILTFWDEHKGGRKTQRAWEDQMRNLVKILEDPKGGIFAVKDQLEKAARAAIHGKNGGWAAITYGNWDKYGKDKTVTAPPKVRQLKRYTYETSDDLF